VPLENAQHEEIDEGLEEVREENLVFSKTLAAKADTTPAPLRTPRYTRFGA
jgi:hypothetical protein